VLRELLTTNKAFVNYKVGPKGAIAGMAQPEEPQGQERTVGRDPTLVQTADGTAGLTIGFKKH
jgi:hypothetical protein